MNVEKYNEERSKLYIKTQTDVFRYVNPHSIFHYLGDVKDKDVLDVGCGNGIYSRLVKTKGAKKVVGVDLSPFMINLAKQQEILNPIGCEYKVVDAENEEIIEEFDAVICVFVLVYADTDEKLSKFCKFIYRNLKMGGICVCLIRNCLSTTFWGNSLQKYGSKFILLDATRDGGFSCKTCIKMLSLVG